MSLGSYQNFKAPSKKLGPNPVGGLGAFGEVVKTRDTRGARTIHSRYECTGLADQNPTGFLKP